MIFDIIDLFYRYAITTILFFYFDMFCSFICPLYVILGMLPLR